MEKLVDNDDGDEGVAKDDLLILRCHYEIFKFLNMRHHFSIFIKFEI